MRFILEKNLHICTCIDANKPDSADWINNISIQVSYIGRYSFVCVHLWAKSVILGVYEKHWFHEKVPSHRDSFETFLKFTQRVQAFSLSLSGLRVFAKCLSCPFINRLWWSSEFLLSSSALSSQLSALSCRLPGNQCHCDLLQYR